MCIPFHEVTLLITIHYFVALVGNDPTTSSMSRKCSPIELQGNLELLTGNDPISLVYKTSASPLMLKKRLRYWLGSNQCDRFCRSVPLVFRHHSATVPYVLLDWRVTIPLPRRYQLRALTIWATVQFCSPGRLRSDSLHYVTVALPRLSYRTICWWGGTRTHGGL